MCIGKDKIPRWNFTRYTRFFCSVRLKIHQYETKISILFKSLSYKLRQALSFPMPPRFAKLY